MLQELPKLAPTKLEPWQRNVNYRKLKSTSGPRLEEVQQDTWKLLLVSSCCWSAIPHQLLLVSSGYCWSAVVVGQQFCISLIFLLTSRNVTVLVNMCWVRGHQKISRIVKELYCKYIRISMFCLIKLYMVSQICWYIYIYIHIQNYENHAIVKSSLS